MKKRRFLAVDQGNSLLKLTLFEGEEFQEYRCLSADASEDVFCIVESWAPDCGCFCSVGKIDTRMVESLRMALGGRLLVLSRSTPLPISIDYSTPSTLGLDRIALATGAVSLYKEACLMVVDAGTAVTLDVVDASASFRGGRISPGIRLRFKALHKYTAALPLVDPDGPTPVAGYSTETAIRSGVILGLADEISETFRQYNKTYGCERLLLTGGDAGILADCINSSIHADHVAHLMARGLLYIYNYNEI